MESLHGLVAELQAVDRQAPSQGPRWGLPAPALSQPTHGHTGVLHRAFLSEAGPGPGVVGGLTRSATANAPGVTTGSVGLQASGARVRGVGQAPSVWPTRPVHSLSAGALPGAPPLASSPGSSGTSTAPPLWEAGVGADPRVSSGTTSGTPSDPATGRSSSAPLPPLPPQPEGPGGLLHRGGSAPSGSGVRASSAPLPPCASAGASASAPNSVAVSAASGSSEVGAGSGVLGGRPGDAGRRSDDASGGDVPALANDLALQLEQARARCRDLEARLTRDGSVSGAGAGAGGAGANHGGSRDGGAPAPAPAPTPGSHLSPSPAAVAPMLPAAPATVPSLGPSPPPSGPPPPSSSGRQGPWEAPGGVVGSSPLTLASPASVADLREFYTKKSRTVSK